eukprot:g28298.t1
MIDEDKVVDFVYMDFSEAFDKGPHCRLVQKVKSHGLRLLGPLLFVVYIIDLEENVAGLISAQITEVAAQMDKVVKKAYGMLVFIGRGIEYKNRQVMLQLYRTSVRLHLEYCIQFWSPHYQKDVDALDRVQKRFARVVSAQNALPEEMMEADTVATFKKHLDEYMNRKGIEGYGS